MKIVVKIFRTWGTTTIPSFKGYKDRFTSQPVWSMSYFKPIWF